MTSPRATLLTPDEDKQALGVIDDLLANRIILVRVLLDEHGHVLKRIVRGTFDRREPIER
jgi:hypothetical protein